MNFVGKIFLYCFAVIAKVESDVPVDVLSFRIAGCTSRVRIPRAYGHIRAQTACIGDGSGSHGRLSRVLVIVR